MQLVYCMVRANMMGKYAGKYTLVSVLILAVKAHSLSPHALQVVCASHNLCSVTTDASNRIAVKKFPKLIQYFD
jgi:hypothetical protein